MGIEHGRACVGSSWALMATLFALVVMSVGWMIPGSPAANETMEHMGTDSMEPARPTRMEDATGAMP